MGKPSEIVSLVHDYGPRRIVREVYKLSLRLPDPNQKPRGLQLQIVDGDGKKNNNWVVIYPTSLAACR